MSKHCNAVPTVQFDPYNMLEVKSIQRHFFAFLDLVFCTSFGNVFCKITVVH